MRITTVCWCVLAVIVNETTSYVWPKLSRRPLSLLQIFSVQDDAKYERIMEVLRQIQTDTSTMRADVSTIRTDMSTMKADLSTRDMSTADMFTVKADISTVKETMPTLKDEVASITKIMEDYQPVWDRAGDTFEIMQSEALKNDMENRSRRRFSLRIGPDCPD